MRSFPRWQRNLPQWQSYRRWQSPATVAVAAMFMLLIAGPSVAFAATVVTLGATGVTMTEASVWGSLDPGGYETSYHFDWGTTSSYGSSTDPYTRSGIGAQFVGASLSGLSPATTYHYRVVALQDGVVVATGDDATFTTLAPVTFSTGSATAVGPGQATLTGTVNPSGYDTWYSFAWGGDTAYGLLTPQREAGSGTGDVAVSATITGLAVNYTYHYALVVYRTDSNGNGVPIVGNDESFTTRFNPTATTGATGGVIDFAATLFGSVNAYGAATSYQFEYGPTTSYGASTRVADAGSGVDEIGVRADIAGLAANTTYHYRLVALRPGIAVYGADRTFTTSPAPIQTKHPPVNRLRPVIVESPMPGVTLTCTPGAWSLASSFAYRWLRDNVPVLAGSSYRPNGTDVGHLLACTVTASNADGSASATSAGVRILDRTPPRMTSLKLSPAAFRAAKSGPSIVTKGNTGALATFRLDERATVTFTVERAQPGRMVTGRCQRETRTNRTGRRCTGWGTVNGSFRAVGRRGANSLRFTGRIGGRRLAPASYRLIARARDNAGNLAQPVRAPFTIRR